MFNIRYPQNDISMEQKYSDEKEITKVEFAKLKNEILRRDAVRAYKKTAAWIVGILLLIWSLYHFL